MWRNIKPDIDADVVAIVICIKIVFKLLQNLHMSSIGSWYLLPLTDTVYKNNIGLNT